MKEIISEIKSQIWILGSIVGLMWGLEILDTSVFHYQLDTWGILPRQAIGLRGILFAPFLHANYAHLSANTVPFLILGWLIMSQSIANFVIVSIICTFVGGFGTWLFGAPALHIGASGVVFGYIGYLLALYFFDRRLSSGLIALFVGCSYGSVLWGIFPSLPGISWEGHLFGLLSGILAAKLVPKS
jgi:membrane associated rhomboid family serine protease